MRLLGYAFLLLIAFGLLSMSMLVIQGRTLFPASWFPSMLSAEAFTVLLMLWVLAETYNNIVSMRNRSGDGKDKGSYWVVIIGLFLLIALVLFLRERNIGVFSGEMQYLGFLIAFAGIVIRQVAIITLGEGFTTRVETKAGRKLTTNGIYNYIRHPSYTGSILTFFGFPIAIGTWAGACAALIICYIMYSYRIKVEEQALIGRYGQEYKEYLQSTWKLFPGF